MPGGEKTEAPTPRRREDAKRKGQTARSTDLSGVIVLIGGLLVLRLTGPDMIAGMMEIMTGAFRNLGTDEFTISGILGDGNNVMVGAIRILLPLLLALALISVAANVVQTGPILSGTPIKPDFKRVNPVKGFQRIFGRDGAVSLVRNLLKVGVVGGVMVVVVRARLPQFGSLGNESAGAGAERFAELTFEVLFLGALTLLVIGLADLV